MYGVRLFYFFHHEDAVLERLITELKANQIKFEYIINGTAQETRSPLPPNTARLTGFENMLIMSINLPLDTWEPLNPPWSELDQSVRGEDFLGKLSILTYDLDNWVDLINELAVKTQRQPAIATDKPEFKLIRLGWLWPDQEAIYVAGVADHQDQQIAAMLDSSLMQVEATALKLHTISELYISQSKYIREEKNRLDRSLTNLLNQQSQMDWNNDNLPDQLQEQLNQLSNAYVTLSGYYRVVREAHSRTANLLSSLRRRIIREPLLADQGIVAGLFLDYYSSRMNSLLELQNDLQSSLNDHSAAIEMLQGQIDLMNNRENLRLQHKLGSVMELNTSLQEQSLTFQIAASLIEFIVLAYYSLSLFKYLAPDAYHHLPAGVLFLLFAGLAAELVMATHIVAERMLGKHKRDFASSIIIILLLLTLGTIVFLAAWL